MKKSMGGMENRMKKFMKGCAITALILIVVGFAMALIAGTISGKKAIKEIVQTVTDGKVNIDLDFDDDGFGINIGEDIGESIGEAGAAIGESIGELGESIGDSIVNVDGTVNYDIEDSMIFDNNYNIFKGDVEKYSLGSSIDDMVIEAGGCSFEMKTSDDENFYVEAQDINKFQGYVINDTLHIKGTVGTITLNGSNECRITLYIPENYQFNKVDMELGAGVMSFESLHADKILMEVGAGQIVADGIVANTLDISVGMGEILVEEMQVNKLVAEVGMGHLGLEGSVNESADVECAMGSIEMEIAGTQKDFNYEVECGMGNIDLGSNSYSGVAQEQYVDNGAAKKMTVECAMGDVDISFTN